jgi:uncharacterized Zn-binding protein involved in type VI secretion
MPMGPAARILDPVVHPAPGMLTPGPGSPDVIIGNKLAWRGVPAGAAAAIQTAKQASDKVITAAEAATALAAGTPGLPAAKAAEETTKATAATTMGSMITAAAGGADIHNCLTPLPIPPHGPGVVIDGSPTVLINGLPACRQGDTIIEAVGPPDKILLGLFSVIIGNVPNTAAGDAAGMGGGGGAQNENPGGGGGGAAGGGGAPVPTTYGSIKLEGTPAERQKMIKALDDIKATPTGAAMLKSIDDSGQQVTIKATTGGNGAAPLDRANAQRKADGSPGSGSGSTVSFNPDRGTIGDGSEPWMTRPPAVGLAHELVHAEHSAHGTNDFTPAGEDMAVGVAPYENQPFTENKIRDEWNPKQPQRPHY